MGGCVTLSRWLYYSNYSGWLQTKAMDAFRTPIASTWKVDYKALLGKFNSWRLNYAAVWKVFPKGQLLGSLENQNTKNEKNGNKRIRDSEKDGNGRKAKRKKIILKRTEKGEKQNAPPLICLGLTNQPIKLCKPPWPQLG